MMSTGLHLVIEVDMQMEGMILSVFCIAINKERGKKARRQIIL